MQGDGDDRSVGILRSAGMTMRTQKPKKRTKLLRSSVPRNPFRLKQRGLVTTVAAIAIATAAETTATTAAAAEATAATAEAATRALFLRTGFIDGELATTNQLWWRYFQPI